jgi:hypothetical protein
MEGRFFADVVIRKGPSILTFITHISMSAGTFLKQEQPKLSHPLPLLASELQSYHLIV